MAACDLAGRGLFPARHSHAHAHRLIAEFGFRHRAEYLFFVFGRHFDKGKPVIDVDRADGAAWNPGFVRNCAHDV